MPVGRSRHRLFIVVGVVSAMMGLSASVVFAMHDTFSDVPDNHVHAPGIHYISEAGITQGFPDGTYRPNDSLTRGQMGTFIERLSGHADDVDASVNAASLDQVIVVEDENTVGLNSTANPAVVACPDGTLAVGGGGTAAIGWVLKDSNPLDNLAGWRVQHRTFDNQALPANQYPATNTVYAVCVPALNVGP
jgi:hypothetical protein